jgi:hypothetical protein
MNEQDGAGSQSSENTDLLYTDTCVRIMAQPDLILQLISQSNTFEALHRQPDIYDERENSLCHVIYDKHYPRKKNIIMDYPPV